MANTVDEKNKKKKDETEQVQQEQSKNQYTLDEAVSVADTGSLPTIQEKDSYTKYMEDFNKEDDFRTAYERQVAENNNFAANQSATARAEYNDLQRNVNEINKANGRANTGYAGDTSIEAFNAYRNAINEAYGKANSSNNELYSYYMQQMMSQQQLDMQKQEIQDQKDNEILGTIEYKMSEPDAKNSDGTINYNKADEIWTYLTDYYGGSENIPRSIMATLNSTPGFKEWLHNNKNKISIESLNSDTNNAEEEMIVKENTFRVYETEEGHRGSANTYGKIDIQGFGKGEFYTNDIDVTINGIEFDLMQGSPETDENIIDNLDKLLSKNGYSKKPKQTCVYNNKMYVVSNKGLWCHVESDSSNVNDAVAEYMKLETSK